AWPEPWPFRARRWLGHHRTWVSTAAATELVTTVGLAVGLVLLASANERERAAKDQETLARVNAEEKETEAKQQRGHAEANLAEAQSQKREADSARRQSVKEKQLAEEQRERAERLVYSRQIALAQHEWQDNEVAYARDLLDACRWDLCGWEHDYLRRLFD